MRMLREGFEAKSRDATQGLHAAETDAIAILGV
jgi:hypothetical protein